MEETSADRSVGMRAEKKDARWVATKADQSAAWTAAMLVASSVDSWVAH